MIQTAKPGHNAKPPILWPVAVFFLLSNVAALTLVPWYGLTFGYGAWAWWSFFVFLMLNGLSITGGYHRLWSHRSYQARWLLKLFYILFGAQALQNSVLIWAARHRAHHRFVDDNARDPYSAKRGLWFSHMGWMIRDWPSGAVDYAKVKDLSDEPLVAWQHRNYWALTWAMNLGLPLAIGFAVGEPWGVLLLGGVLRLVVSHHLTFFINSLAHFIGRQTYSDDNTARDSHLMALLTWGEGYHNFHHAFMGDYRNGVRWWHLDMGKWFILFNTLLGQAHSLRRVPAFKIRRARIHVLFKQASERLAEQSGEYRQRWQAVLEQEYHHFVETVQHWQKLQSAKLHESSQHLRDRWQRTALASRLRELDFRLKLQQQRLQFLLRQSLQAA